MKIKRTDPECHGPECHGPECHGLLAKGQAHDSLKAQVDSLALAAENDKRERLIAQGKADGIPLILETIDPLLWPEEIAWLYSQQSANPKKLSKISSKPPPDGELF